MTRLPVNPESLIHSLFHYSGVGIAICDKRFRFKTVNNALASMNGFPVRAHLGKPISALLGDVAETVVSSIESAFRTGHSVSNLELTAKLPARSDVGHWIENYVPIKDSKGKVKQVGVFVVVEIGPETHSDLISNLADLPCLAPVCANSPSALSSQISRTFPDLYGQALQLLEKTAKRCTYPPGYIFCHQGYRSRNLYVLIKGIVKISGISAFGKETLLDWVQAGEAFSLGALLTPPAEDFWSIYSTTNTEVLEWDAATIRRIAESCPKFYANALSIALDRSRQLQQRFQELSTKTVEQRLADVVGFLSERSRNGGKGDIDISDEELAAMTGTNVFTVNKLIRAWHKAGYVRKERRHISIREREALLRIAVS